MNQDAFQQQLSNSSYKLNQEIETLNKNNDLYIFIACVFIGAVIIGGLVELFSSFKKKNS